MVIQDANSKIGIGGEVEHVFATYLSLLIQFPPGSSALFAPLYKIIMPEGELGDKHLFAFRNIFGYVRPESWQALRNRDWSAPEILLDTRTLLADEKDGPIFKHNISIDAKKSLARIFRETLESILTDSADNLTDGMVEGMRDLICFVGYTQDLKGHLCPLRLGQCRFGKSAGVERVSGVAQGSDRHKAARSSWSKRNRGRE